MRLPFSQDRPVVSVSSTICRIGCSLPPEALGLLAREAIDALVAGIAAVALDPAPIDAMPRAGRVQPLPQVLVLDRVAAGGAPVAAQPVRQPQRDALAHVLRVGVQHDRAAFGERLQRHDRGGQFHAVVGGERFAAGDLLLASAEAQQRGPAARAGIAQAGAVGMDLDLLGRLRHGHAAGTPPPMRNGPRWRTGVSGDTRFSARSIQPARRPGPWWPPLTLTG